MIAVMGAAGNTGRVVAEALLAKGEKVRVLGRDAGKLEAFRARGAEVVAGDAADAGFLAKAFASAEAAYTLIPPDMAVPAFRAYQDRIGAAIAKALREAKVRRVVLLSSLGAEHPAGTGPIAGLFAQEARLRELGIDALFLRAGYFYENTFASLPLVRHQGMNGGALAPDVPVAMVATRDIGAAAAAALLARDFSGPTVRDLVGPRDYTLREVTRVLGAAIGKPDLAYVQFPYDAFAGALVQAGLSPDLAGQYAEMSRALNEGRIRPTQGRTPRTTGTTTFEEFAPALAAAYRAG
jgi:uncharacterized protein YbjT (DUF2867 family)